MSGETPVATGVSGWFNRTGWRDILIGTPYVWLILFFLVPFIIVVAMSLAMRAGQSPPFAFLDGWPYVRFDNFARLFEDNLFVRSFLISLYNAAIATVLCLLIGYPMALGLTRVDRKWRNFLLMLVILPFWTSFLLRVYAWIGLMGTNSWFNKGLTAIYNAIVPADWAIHSIQLDEHELRGRARDGLFVSAVHDPAAVCEPGKAGHDAERGGAGSRLSAAAGVLGRDAAAFASRHHCRRPACVHPSLRRTDHSEPRRQLVGPDDRPRHQRSSSPTRGIGRWRRQWPSRFWSFSSSR